jgi:hypothetical protein
MSIDLPVFGDCLNTLCLAVEKYAKNVTDMPHIIVFKKNMGSTIRVAVEMSHANVLIVRGHFKNMSRINTDSLPIVLSTDVATQMEPSFISERYELIGLLSAITS